MTPEEKRYAQWGLGVAAASLVVGTLTYCTDIFRQPSPQAPVSSDYVNTDLPSSAPIAAETPADIPDLPVYPATAAGLSPIEVADVIVMELPPQGATQLNWTHMLSGPVAWSSNGYDRTETGLLMRNGWFRGRIKGRMPTVVRQQQEELAWRVTLESDTNPNFGPQRVFMQPGGEGDDACFGSLNQSCAFTAQDILFGSSLSSELVCESGHEVEGRKTYRVRTSDGRAGAVSFVSSGGSGGVSSWIEIDLWRDAAQVCQDPAI